MLRIVCEQIAEGFEEPSEKSVNDISNCDYNSEMGESDPEFDDGFEPNRVSFFVPTPKTKYQQISTLSKSLLNLKQIQNPNPIGLPKSEMMEKQLKLFETHYSRHLD